MGNDEDLNQGLSSANGQEGMDIIYIYIYMFFFLGKIYWFYN